MTDRIEEQEILDVLQAIERGDVTVLPPTPAEHYCGNVEHKTSNGWTFIIFDDCDEWDYIDTVIAPDGREVFLWHEPLVDNDRYERLREYNAEDRGVLHRWPTW